MILVEVGELVVDIGGPGNVLRDFERDSAILVRPVGADHAVRLGRVFSVVLAPGYRDKRLSG